MPIFELMIGILAFIFGILVLIYSSDKAVEHSISIASARRVSPFMIGLLLVSIGTDLPEIANSITSCALGHGDINVGDSLGSAMTQMTLILGLLPLIGGIFKVKRKEIIITGVCLILALILAFSVAEKGYFTRINALFLVTSWILFMLITRTVTRTEPAVPSGGDSKTLYHLVIAVLGYIGVAVGAYIMVQSVIVLSEVFRIHEYIVSFFLVAIGTSLPELFVDLTAIRKKQYELAIGDIIGSSIVDASISIGIGPLLFPPPRISGEFVRITGLYAILASIIVILTLALREKVDRKTGILFIVVYLISYTLLY